MLWHHIKIAVRSLRKFQGYNILNLIGLSFGLTAGILILIYVMDELSYDRFHANRDRIYRVVTDFSDASIGGVDTNGWPVGDILRNEFPQVEAVMYSHSAGSFMINHEGKKFRQNLCYASPEFFRIFSFPLKEGNPGTALNDPWSVVITESMARKFFGGHDALNQSLILQDTLHFIVTGILKDFPARSHIQMDMILSFETFRKLDPEFRYEEGWGNVNMRNYVLLREGADEKALAARVKNLYMERAGEMMKSWGMQAYVTLEPLTDIYLRTSHGNGMGPVGNIRRVYLVSGIALFVILLACINYINLSTAWSAFRAREVGLRKISGSTRRSLIFQFLGESSVLTVFSFLMSFILFISLLPWFNQLIGKNYGVHDLFRIPVIIGIVVLILLITFLSGFYPSLVLSSYKPAEVLKGNLSSGPRGILLRRTLVTIQFTISMGLVLGTMIIHDQLGFMKKQALGFDKDEIFVINASEVNASGTDVLETFKNKLKTMAVVDRVSTANQVPGRPGWFGQIAYPEGKSGKDAISVEYMAIDEDYLKCLGLKLIAGHDFNDQAPAELKEGLVLNETAVAQMGWPSPEEAIGKKITSPSGYPEGVVIGVVKDYHELGLQQKISPMTMDYNPGAGHLFIIRYKAADTHELIRRTGEIWEKTFPGYEFNYFFLSDEFDQQYQSEERLASVFGTFSIVTILIAAIGLTGLVSFMVVTRTREIGIRKILGAGLLQITGLFSGEFIRLVILADLILIPAGWYLAHRWLQSFASRMILRPWIFVLTITVAVLLTLITVSFQTIRAALANPVDSLRNE